jgi:hypothetical protein
MHLQKFFLSSFFLSLVGFSAVTSDIKQDFEIEAESSTDIDIGDVTGFQVKASGDVTLVVPYKIKFANNSPNKVSVHLTVDRLDEYPLGRLTDNL